MNASLNRKFEAVKWGEYKLGDIFKIEKTLSFNADSLVEGSDYDYVTRTSTNQGVLRSTGFVNQENINKAGTWSLGLLQMDFFYRPKEWYAGQFVEIITPKINIPPKTVPFFSTILNQQKPVLKSVLVRYVDKTFRELTINLPVTQEGAIDFDFMESFIADLGAVRVAELEAERAAELKVYLQACGLSDCLLTEEEESALENLSVVNWGEYKLGDLFKIESYKKRFDAYRVTLIENGGHPYIVRQSTNNGKKGNIDEQVEYLNDGNTISFGQDTATMFYQEQPYFTGDKIKILKPKQARFGKNNAQFFLAAMRKTFSLFSWGSSRFNMETLNSQVVLLPAKEDKSIDFDFIETYIFAVQKLVIRDVVRYADEKIALTEEAVRKGFDQ